MNNKEFSELHLRVTIVPQQVSWPGPGTRHWQKLHDAANEARARVSRFYTLADEIDRNLSISRDAKCRERSKAAAEAISEFDSSKTLVRAREAVELVTGKRNFEGHLLPEIAKDRDATQRAMKQAEKGWQRAIDKIAERSCQTRGPSGVWRDALK